MPPSSPVLTGTVWTMPLRAAPLTRCGGTRWSNVSHRPYATGFYYGYPGQYYENSRYIREWQVVALVTECDSDGNAVISLRNKFRTGDTVELVGPDLRPFSMTVPEMRDEAGTVIEEPRNPQMLLKLRLPRPVPPMTLVRHQVELSAK